MNAMSFRTASVRRAGWFVPFFLLLMVPAAASAQSRCVIDFNQPSAIRTADPSGLTFATKPYAADCGWYGSRMLVEQTNNSEYHLLFERSGICHDGSTGKMGAYDANRRCIPFPDPSLEPRRLAPHLATDTLKVWHRHAVFGVGTWAVRFNLRTIRVISGSVVIRAYFPDGSSVGWVASKGWWSVPAAGVMRVEITGAPGSGIWSVDDIEVSTVN